MIDPISPLIAVAKFAKELFEGYKKLSRERRDRLATLYAALAEWMRRMATELHGGHARPGLLEEYLHYMKDIPGLLTTAEQQLALADVLLAFSDLIVLIAGVVLEKPTPDREKRLDEIASELEKAAGQFEAWAVELRILA